MTEMKVDPRLLCQIEIPVAELERSKLFYREVFGWNETSTEIHEVCVIDVPRDCGFGISLVRRTFAASTESPVMYFLVNDPESILDRARAGGGRLLSGPARQPGYGCTWRIADPDGNVWGLFQRQG